MAPPTHDTLVIIPAWNEADVLSGVLQEVLETVGSFADVVVVSDGSTDGTADIARSVGVPVLDLSINLGVGGAMRAGYLYAQRQGYTYTVQLDADGQHAPEEITSLLHEAEEAGAAEGSGTEPSLGACADTITIPTAQAPDGAARELRADQYRPARPFRYW